MFTQKQIEEIAARLAEIAVKDSQFIEVSTPFNGTEYIPVLQNDQNKLMPLSALSNNGQGGGSQLTQCILTIKCAQSTATVRFNGITATKVNGGFAVKASYGTMINVEVSASNYVTWFGVITLTANQVVDISLVPSNSGSGSGSGESCGCGQFCTCWEYPDSSFSDDEDYSGSDTPGTDPSVIQYSVTVISKSGIVAFAQVNSKDKVPLTLGQERWFKAGSNVRITAKVPGYRDFERLIVNIDRNHIIDLDEIYDSPETEPYLRFTIPEITLNAYDMFPLNASEEWKLNKKGKTLYVIGSSGIDCNMGLDWEIVSETIPDYEEDSSAEPIVSVSPTSATLIVGEEFNITVSS